MVSYHTFAQCSFLYHKITVFKIEVTYILKFDNFVRITGTKVPKATEAYGILSAMETSQLEREQNNFEKLILLFICFFLFFALISFVLRYHYSERDVLRSLEFYRTFYFFFALFCACTVLLFQAKTLLSTILLCFLCFTEILVIDYSLSDYLTIRLALYLAFLTALLMRCPFPYSLICTAVFSLFATLLQMLPPFLGENDLNQALVPASAVQLFSFFMLLFSFGSLLSLLIQYRTLYEKTYEQTLILNTTITKLTVFSQSLQSYARTAELEAIKKERYRISREIHDISGYMFTNIIAMMDAIISTGSRNSEKTSEMCLAARIQAQEGLVETRKALHMLRDSEADRDTGMKAIHKIKKIFESTTGVKVEIEAGNLPASFGDTIDLILYRIVQEGLTNALRHGHATCVRMLFWIVESSVQVIILDNGGGAKKIIKGIGLAGMEERISKLGGTVQAQNAPEGGFQLTVIIPLGKEYDNDTHPVG